MQTYQTDFEKLREEVDERIDAMHPHNYDDEASWKHDCKELKSNIDSLLQAREEWLRESVKNLTPFSIGVPHDPLVSKDAVLSLLTNNEPELSTKG